jgi:DNA-directed RNA polymerase specialized sigma24 family protein
MEIHQPQWRAAYGYALAILGDRDVARQAADRVLDQALADGAAGEPARTLRWWLRTVRGQAIELARERHRGALTAPEELTEGDQSARPLTRLQREVAFLRNVLDLSTEETADVLERPPAVVRWAEQRTLARLLALTCPHPGDPR